MLAKLETLQRYLGLKLKRQTLQISHIYKTTLKQVIKAMQQNTITNVYLIITLIWVTLVTMYM